VPAGRAGDRWGAPPELLVGVAAFLLAYLGFALAAGLALLALAFLLAGAGIGLVETAENAAVAALAPAQVRGSAFGVLAATQGFGQLVASALAGLLWTAVSPTLAFGYLALFALLAIAGVGAAALPGRRLLTPRGPRSRASPSRLTSPSSRAWWASLA